ncbi:hypothetical protein WJX72_007058 [[Myrmecia] bisecta]|uniref:PLOD1-3-like GT domain-containing protein n=1 Tax=[Myrmecia] bisecta TaxID=41462 RepID=A0AAW1P514_9CHLO
MQISANIRLELRQQAQCVMAITSSIINPPQLAAAWRKLRVSAKGITDATEVSRVLRQRHIALCHEAKQRAARKQALDEMLTQEALHGLLKEHELREVALLRRAAERAQQVETRRQQMAQAAAIRRQAINSIRSEQAAAETARLRAHKPLYQKLEEAYSKRHAEEDAQRRQQLAAHRQQYAPLDMDQIRDHERTLPQKLAQAEAELRQKRRAEAGLLGLTENPEITDAEGLGSAAKAAAKLSPQYYKGRNAARAARELALQRRKADLAAEERAAIRRRQQQYGKVVKALYQPGVDPSKQAETEEHIRYTQPMRPHAMQRYLQTEASYQPKLHTVTVATYDMESLHTMLKSNPDVILLGMGEQWGGFRTKFILMLDFLRTVHPDDVVLFVDAFDTLFLECDRGLLETYLALGHDIIFNAETNCWPEQWKAPFFPEHPGPWRAPHIQHRPRFLNSGVYMGRVRALLHYYTKDFVANGQWENPGLDDQRWWVDLFLAQQMHPEKARNEPSIAIDYAGDLFQEVAAAPYLPFYSWERDPVTNHVRNTDGVYSQPACLIHAPGWMTPLWGVLQPRLEAKETILLSPELMRPYGDAWYTHTAEPKAFFLGMPSPGCSGFRLESCSALRWCCGMLSIAYILQVTLEAT